MQEFDDKQQGAHALIVNDGSGTGVALSERLLKAGWNVSVLNPNWLVSRTKKTFAKAVNVIDIGSSDNTLDETQVKQTIENLTQLDTVIYMQAVNTVTSIEYPAAAKQGLKLAFILAKLSNVKNAMKARGSFVVVTRQGGTLGFTSDESQCKQTMAVKANINADLVQAGLAGLVKTINHEWNTGANSPVFCRLVDLSAKLAANKAANIINDELHDIDTTTVEVAYDTDKLTGNLASRFTLTAVTTDSYALTPNSTSVDKHSVFLVSGGAKGVTAHCVIEIAKQYHGIFSYKHFEIFSY